MPYSWTTAFSTAAALVWGIQVLAQATATLDGTAIGYEGLEVRIFALSDPITRVPERMAETRVRDDGTFTLHFDCANTGQAWLALRRFTAPVYIDPGARYRIAIAAENESALIRTWQKGALQYTIERVDSTAPQPDINLQIAAIDQAYYNFLAAHEQVIGQKSFKSAYYRWAGDLKKEYAGDDYAAQYLLGTLAEIKLIAGFTRKEIYDSTFAQLPSLPQNPGWWTAFDLFYANCLDQYSNRNGGAEMYNRINAGLSIALLDSLLRADSFLERKELRDLVLIHGLHQAAYDKKYNTPAVVELLRGAMKAATAANSALARRALDKIGQSEKRTMFDFDALYPVVKQSTEVPTLVFVSVPWSSVSLKESLALEALHQQYKEVFDVIEVSLAEVEDPQHKRPWPVVQPQHILDFMDARELYQLPAFLWLNTSGHVENAAAARPSQELEKTLYRLKSKQGREQSIKVGQEAPR